MSYLCYLLEINKPNWKKVLSFDYTPTSKIKTDIRLVLDLRNHNLFRDK